MARSAGLLTPGRIERLLHQALEEGAACVGRAECGTGAQDVDATGKQALERLIGIARSDTGQSRRVADFLLAWWNAATCGAFDLTHLWGVDDAIAADMVKVFAFVAATHKYPDTLGYKDDFEAIVRAWRPALE